MEYKIRKDIILEYNGIESTEFPKYTSQIINWANQNAQGTRPRVVGQLSELFPEYLKESDDVSVENWERWYVSRYPDAMGTATDKIYDQVQKLKEAIQLIDYDMVADWVHNLVIEKTYAGLYLQKAILTYLSEVKNLPYRLATPEEESRGIDGFVGDEAYSIKPETYHAVEDLLPEEINLRIVYYKKSANDIIINVQE